MAGAGASGRDAVVTQSRFSFPPAEKLWTAKRAPPKTSSSDNGPTYHSFAPEPEFNCTPWFALPLTGSVKSTTTVSPDSPSVNDCHGAGGLTFPSRYCLHGTNGRFSGRSLAVPSPTQSKVTA